MTYICLGDSQIEKHTVWIRLLIYGKAWLLGVIIICLYMIYSFDITKVALVAHFDFMILWANTLMDCFTCLFWK